MTRHNSKRRRQVLFVEMQPLEARRLLTVVTSVSVIPDYAVIPNAHGGFGGWNGGGGLGNNQINYFIPPSGYSPAQISEAYGFNDITYNGSPANGAGTTIAIVDAYNDPNISSDLKTFDANFKLAAPPSFTEVSQSGGPVSSVATDAGWGLETSLDVEWAHAIAPAANIVLVEAKSDSISDLVAAVNEARNYQNVSVVSMSWGGSEFANEASYAADFTTPSGHINETFVAASGDSGPFAGAQWPASNTSVLSVGGTSLDTLNSSGAYGTETAWAGSSGGLSSNIGEPSYQETAQTSGLRAVPDVAYDANPNTGFAVYDSLAYDGAKGWQEVGGTSAGAPQWAALIAIADQGRLDSHQSTLDGLTETLPALYDMYAAPGTAAYATYAADFHDINSGGGSFFFGGGATAGYDLTTGLGSPDAPAIVSSLIGAVPVTVTDLNITPSNISTGRRGGGFAVTPSTATDTTPPTISPSVTPSVTPSGTPSGTSSGTPSGTTTPTGPGLPNNPPPPIVHPAQPGGQTVIATIPGREVVSPAQYSGLQAQISPAHAYNGTLWLDAIGVAGADVAAHVGVAAGAAAAGAVRVVSHTVAPAATVATAAVHTAVQGRIWLQLAKLDANLFADSLRSFAHESAAVGAAGGRTAWPRTLAIAASAILADTIVVGYWYFDRVRRKAKIAAGPPPAGE